MEWLRTSDIFDVNADPERPPLCQFCNNELVWQLLTLISHMHVTIHGHECCYPCSQFPQLYPTLPFLQPEDGRRWTPMYPFTVPLAAEAHQFYVSYVTKPICPSWRPDNLDLERRFELASSIQRSLQNNLCCSCSLDWTYLSWYDWDWILTRFAVANLK